MDTNPRLTYLILLSPLPVVFLSAFPRRAVIRHVENTHAKKKKKMDRLFFILSSHPCDVAAGAPPAFCSGLLSAEVKGGCHQSYTSLAVGWGVGGRLDQNTTPQIIRPPSPPAGVNPLGSLLLHLTPSFTFT